jgi:predicted flap endonuclease-1-like 5' DNA nuclease
VPATPAVVEEVVPARVEAEKAVETEATESAPVELPAVQVTAPDTEQVDDFTPLNDIGPAFNQKLHEAGIKTFAALASLSPEEIEEKTGISAERVERKKWREQAQAKLKGTEPENS